MRRVAPLLLAALETLAGCGSGSGSSATPAAAACRPDRPERIVDAPLDERNLMHSGPAATVDTDGNGVPDVVTVDGGQVHVTRGDGTVTLARVGADVALLTWGDLDGDGRDDILVNDGAVVVVNGETEPGTHDPRTVGVRVGDALNYVWPGDLDGRAGADLAVLHRVDGASTTDVYSGAAILAKGPGGDARDQDVARTLPGLPRGIAPLARGAAPETLLLAPGDPTAIRFASRPRAELRAFGPATRVEDIRVFDEGGTRKISLTVDRRTAVWAVPPACR